MSQSTTSPMESLLLDRRTSTPRRQGGDRRVEDIPVAEDRRVGQRRKTQRRRQIDPTTCERDYTGDEVEFMRAIDAYKRASGRMFPTCSEILEVVRSLGYVRICEDGQLVPAAISGVSAPEEDEESLDEESGD